MNRINLNSFLFFANFQGGKYATTNDDDDLIGRTDEEVNSSSTTSQSESVYSLFSTRRNSLQFNARVFSFKFGYVGGQQQQQVPAKSEVKCSNTHTYIQLHIHRYTHTIRACLCCYHSTIFDVCPAATKQVEIDETTVRKSNSHTEAERTKYIGVG